MTILLIIITSIISIIAFSNRDLFAKLQFNAYLVIQRKQWYRLISHGFVHANWSHLLVNMFVLYFFGSTTEEELFKLADYDIVSFPILTYILFYFSALIISSSISLAKHKDDHWYNAVGASGAVAAVLYFSIFFDPWSSLRLYFFIPIPAIVFAILYIVYSHYMGRKGQDNIGHEAHLMGAVYGFIFPLFIDLDLIKVFIHELINIHM